MSNVRTGKRDFVLYSEGDETHHYLFTDEVLVCIYDSKDGIGGSLLINDLGSPTAKASLKELIKKVALKRSEPNRRLNAKIIGPQDLISSFKKLFQNSIIEIVSTKEVRKECVEAFFFPMTGRLRVSVDPYGSTDALDRRQSKVPLAQ